MTRSGAFMAAVWLACMAPVTLLMAVFHVPYADKFWKFWGLV
jgi:hypothetical protein